MQCMRARCSNPRPAPPPPAAPPQVTETQAAQIQLDRAAEDYRRLHTERQQLVAAWDAAAAAMRRRDEAIGAASAAFAERRVALRRRRGKLDAQAALLEGEAAAYRELEARIAHFEKEVVSARSAGQRRIGMLQQLHHHQQQPWLGISSERAAA